MKTKLGTSSCHLTAALGDHDQSIIVSPDVADSPCAKGHAKDACGTDFALAEIERALGRLDRGTYGLCLQCGGEISLARLDRNPLEQACEECVDAEAPQMASSA